MKKKVIFVTASREINCNVTGIFKKMFGGNVKIEPISAPRVFERQGLTTLIKQNKNIGPVFIIDGEFRPEVVKEAEVSGLQFGIVEKNPFNIRIRNNQTVTVNSAP